MKVNEIRSAWRRLRSRRASTLISLLVLGVGLGAVVFVLGMINGLILKPLPFPEAERLVAIGHEREKDTGVGDMDNRDYLRLRGEWTSFVSTGAYAETSVTLVREQRAKYHLATALTVPMLTMLGAEPLIGRAFEAVDDSPGAARTALIGENLWRADFGSDPNVLGQTVKIDGESTMIVGVMPATFAFPYASEIWLPAKLRVGESLDLTVVGLLKPDRDLGVAKHELTSLTKRLGSELVSQRTDRQLTIKPLAIRYVDEKTRAYLWLMFAASAVVLLLACVNVSNLQLSQTLKRSQELAIRTALGANRFQLLREQLAESLILSTLAIMIALVIGQLAANWLSGVFIANEQAPPYFVSMGVDWRILGFAMIAALLTTMIAGMAPALRAARSDVNQALRDGDKSTTQSGLSRVAPVLVVAQVAFTVLLLVGAGTLIRGLDRMLDMDLGIHSRPEQLLTARVTLPSERFADDSRRLRFFENVIERLRADPGVVSASTTTTVPGALLGSHEYIGAFGAPRPERGYQRAQLGIVDDHFADVFSIRLSEGRFFDARDSSTNESVAVVDESLAKMLWPDRDPVGQKLVVNPESQHPDIFSVIGVVPELHLEGPLDPSLPTFLASFRQFPQRSASLAIATRGDPLAFGPRLAEAVRSVDAETPVYQLRTQARAIDIERLSAVVLAQVFATLGVVALLLASAGLYGVLAFAVEQRAREIGVRRALGADAAAIVRRIGRPLLIQVCIGLLVGLILSVPWSTLLADPALHTRGNDLSVFSTVLATIAIVSVLAAFFPLLRALRVDPMIALRHD